MEKNNNYEWSTHQPVIKTVLSFFSPKFVLELGSGIFSTPLLFESNTEEILCEENDNTWVDYLQKELKFPEKASIRFYDFVKLEKLAAVVLTDSGTVPEETSLFRVPCVVLRNTTERQELMEKGSFILAGFKTKDILRAFNHALTVSNQWSVDEEYLTDVADTVVNILIGLTPIIIRKGHDEY